jgi:hypothetical protein
MKNIIIGLLVLVSLVQFGCSCKRTDDIIGPSACPSDTFAVKSGLTVMDNASSSSNLNFASSYTKIGASFNETITYRLSITAIPSGAIYVYEGKGSSLAINWYGSSTNGKYFKQGDGLTISLTNLCKSEPLGTTTATITTIVGYAGFGYKTVNFDESPAIYSYPFGYGDIAAPYGSGRLMIPASAGYKPSPQGGNYYKFRADSVSVNTFKDPSGKNITWYFGGADLFISTPVQFSSLGADPTKVYLNFFARGQANSQAQMIIDEKANGINLRRKFLANVGSEWTLYSVKLSDIGIINPSGITSFSFNLGGALRQDSSAEVDLDLVIFTLDKPF